jgi:hypothetical protein
MMSEIICEKCEAKFVMETPNMGAHYGRFGWVRLVCPCGEILLEKVPTGTTLTLRED